MVKTTGWWAPASEFNGSLQLPRALDQGQAKKIVKNSAKSGVKRLKKCARNIPPGHTVDLNNPTPLLRPPNWFVPARDFNGSPQLPCAFDQGRTQKCDRIRVKNVANRRKNVRKTSPHVHSLLRTHSNLCRDPRLDAPLVVSSTDLSTICAYNRS